MTKFKVLSGDVDPAAYGGSWYRKVGDRYHVIVLTNMDDACGSDNEGMSKYVVELREINPHMNTDEIGRALRSCGPDIDEMQSWTPEQRELAIVESLCSYGTYAPLGSWSGNNHGKLTREARAESRNLESDPSAYDAAMDKPVNRIGSTAREYQSGDLDSAIRRGMAGGKPEAILMGKISGVGLVEPSVTFGTLQPDGVVADVRRIKHSDLRKCPFLILVPTHYRADGSCKCDDPEERARMIREWGYTEADFARIS